MSAAASPEALLRRFEPVVRSTKGDKFFPMDVEPYVRACSLWVQRPGEEAICVAPRGKLDLDRLAQQPLDEVGAVHFLKFTDPRDLAPPGSRIRVFGRRAARGLKESREAFRAGRGRLARVGYFSRFVDALYSITLLARGRVPGEAAAAASVSYERIMAEEGARYRYHGRVTRQDGWVVLQYWLFYPFNDWRSGFFGANDHEADWEKIIVYLSESETTGEVRPEWVAYAAHNYTGDNLRRRWDDPEVEKVGEHPVIYVGAGSHASYYAPGEYLTELNLPLPRTLARAANAVRSFWKERMGQYAGEDEEGPGYLHIPFVDYARGDGLSIGAGGDREWDPPRLMLDPPPRWVSGYRGLWGLYARDPFEGEDAPAGPMYNRDKSVNRAWYDPVGWAGLDKVSPPDEALDAALARHADLEARCAALRTEISEKSRRLKRLGVEVAAMRGRSHLDAPYEEGARHLAELSGELDRLRARLATDEAVSRSLEEYAGRLRAGERDPARAHISRAHRPASEAELRVSRVAEAWAAASVSLMLISFVAIAIFEREHLISMLVLSIALFAFVEAGFRGRLVNLVSSVNIGLAVVAALILLYEFFWPLVVTAVLGVGLYVLWDNLRELGR
ncbi:MAG TPA: hypothetical protein VHH10_05945 [Rubrobacteraceae bacterium]|nr:hypothetical protein [Rubrobacteraceae bacterium]